MQPAAFDLRVERGDAVRVTFRLQRLMSGVAVPLDLTGSTMSLEISWRGGALVKTPGTGLTVTSASGLVVWSASEDDTTEIPAGRVARYALVRTSSDRGRRTYVVGYITGTEGVSAGDLGISVVVNDVDTDLTVLAGPQGEPGEPGAAGPQGPSGPAGAGGAAYLPARQMPNWRRIRQAVRRGAGRGTVVWIGDSIPYGAYLPSVDDSSPRQQAKRLTELGIPALALSRFGNGSNGAAAPYDLRSQDPAVLYDPTQWAPNVGAPCPGGYLMGGANPDSSFIYRPREVTDRFRVRYAWYPGATLPKVSVDLGATWTVLPAGTDPAGEYITSAPIVTPRAALNSLWFTTSIATQVVFFGAVSAWDSQTPAVDIYNLGACGWTTGQWVQDASPWAPLTALARIAPDLAYISLGTNNEAAQVNDASLAAYVAAARADLQRILDVVRLSGDAVLVVPVPAATSFIDPAVQSAYAAMIHALGLANGVPVVDRAERWTDYATAQQQGDYADLLVHPSPAGAADLGFWDAEMLAAV